MFASEIQRKRIAVVGAGSLRGRELRQVLNRQAAGFRIALYDEDAAVGTVTETAGEAALIEAVDPDSFHADTIVFFTGSLEQARRYLEPARASGAWVVDLSEGPGLVEAKPWIAWLDVVRPAPVSVEQRLARSPAALTMVSCALLAATLPLGVRLIVLQGLAPVSDYGQAGIEELEAQTRRLFTFQPLPRQVFGAQIAFNVICGGATAQPFTLQQLQQAVLADIAAYWAATPVRIHLVQAPIFYGTAFAGYLEFADRIERDRLEQALVSVGFLLQSPEEVSPVQVSLREPERPVIAPPEPDVTGPGAWWIWGVADNVRLVVQNAWAIAEKVLSR